MSGKSDAHIILGYVQNEKTTRFPCYDFLWSLGTIWFRLVVVSNSRTCVPNDRHSGPRPFSALVVGSTSFAFSRVGEHAAERCNRMQSPLWESTHCGSCRDIAGIFLLNLLRRGFVRAQLSFDTLFGRDRRKTSRPPLRTFLEREKTFLLIQRATRVTPETEDTFINNNSV